MPAKARTSVRRPAVGRDTRWLELRHRTYYAVLSVPRPLRAKLGGKAKLVQSLHTHDLHVAVAKRHAALADFQRVLDRARGIEAANSVVDAAMTWRRTLARIAGREMSAIYVGGPGGQTETDPEHIRAETERIIDEQAEDIEAQHGAPAARTFLGVAYGTATPLLMHADAWLTEGGAKGPLNARTAAQYRANLLRLQTWLAAQGITTVEGVTKAVAGRFVTEELVAKGVHWATGNRRISALSAYWRWLRKRAGIEADPWAGQALSKGPARDSRKTKRPFTDAEVMALLAGPADPELTHAMRVAALSGMRLEELYRLTVADCAAGWFAVKVSKTRAGVRRVPIHSALADIVARRCASRAPEAFLFGEAGPARAGRERSAALSARFTVYRRARGVDDRLPEARHSRVDFHSWRRWFVTQARNAGIEREVVAAVVGHAAQDMTDGVYRGDVADALLRACVAAVRLPEPVVTNGRVE